MLLVFFKKIKLIFISIMLLTMPINALAYSDYIYASGKSIGINIKLKGIMVVGLMKSMVFLQELLLRLIWVIEL